MQKTTSAEALQTQVYAANIPPIEAFAATAPLIPSTPLALVKQGRRQPRSI